MKVIYIHQYFHTPEEGGAIRSWYIASALAWAGHEVDLITAHNEFPETREINGFRVHYLSVRYENKFGTLRRLMAFLLFTTKALKYIRKLGRFDKAYITSTPLTVGWIALSLNKRYGIPYIFEVRDLWPEVLIQAKAIRTVLFKRITEKFEHNIYQKASGLVALSPGIADYIRSSVPGNPVHLCPNLSDCDFFRMEQPGDEGLMKQLNLENKFIIGYFGAIGRLNALEFLIDAAEYFQHEKAGISFLVIGNGSRKVRLMNMTREKQLKNVIFIDHLNKFTLRKYLSLIDAAYISFAPLTILQTNSPNKFYDALASGKMIILNFEGWLKDLTEKYECGFYADPRNPAEFYDKLQAFIHDRGKLAQFQHNARRLAEDQFERGRLTRDLVRFIEN